MYLSRDKGGTGIPSVFEICAQEISNLATYFTNSQDLLVNEIKYFEAKIAPYKTILCYKQNGPKYRTKTICDEKNEQLCNKKSIYGKLFCS